MLAWAGIKAKGGDPMRVVQIPYLLGEGGQRRAGGSALIQKRSQNGSAKWPPKNGKEV